MVQFKFSVLVLVAAAASAVAPVFALPIPGSDDESVLVTSPDWWLYSCITCNPSQPRSSGPRPQVGPAQRGPLGPRPPPTSTKSNVENLVTPGQGGSKPQAWVVYVQWSSLLCDWFIGPDVALPRPFVPPPPPPPLPVKWVLYAKVVFLLCHGFIIPDIATIKPQRFRHCSKLTRIGD